MVVGCMMYMHVQLREPQFYYKFYLIPELLTEMMHDVYACPTNEPINISRTYTHQHIVPLGKPNSY